jgi:hypothetical protein
MKLAFERVRGALMASTVANAANVEERVIEEVRRDMEASSRPGAQTNPAREPSRQRPLLLAAVAAALVFLVALGSSRSLARVGGPGHLLGARSILGDVVFVFFVLAVLVLAGLTYALWSGPRRRRRGDEPEWLVEEPPMQWWEKPLLLAMAFLPVAGLITVIVLLVRHLHHTPRVTATIPSPPSSTVPQHPHPGSVPSGHATTPVVHWWLWAVLVAALLMAAVVVTLVRRRFVARTRRGERVAASGELQALIEESLEELAREPDPRRAVIRAYAGMERAFARRGLGRRPFEAPLEYLARALAAIRVSRPAGTRLTALFERARFSEHAIDQGMKQEAIGALAAVRDELAEQTK